MALRVVDLMSKVIWCLLVMVTAALLGQSQAATTNDEHAQPRALLEAALTAIGGPCPEDLRLSGDISATLGSSDDTGRVQVLIGGSRQSKEVVDVSRGGTSLVAVGERAAETVEGKRRELPRERALTAPTSLEPAVWLERALDDPRSVFEYIGVEFINGESAHRVRVSTVFSGAADADLGPLSRRDFWISAARSLPLRLSFEERFSRGGEPGVPVDVNYENYVEVGERLHPMTIDRWLNGTPWQRIQINSVTYDSIPTSEFSLD